MKLFRGVAVSSVAFLLSLAMAQPALAQQTNKASKEDNGIGVGVEGMVNFPSVSNLNTGFDTKTGYGIGLWVGGNKNGTVGFTGEFVYKTSTIENTSGTSTATRHALEIPAVFHINIGSKSKNGIAGYGVVGPVFTINVNNTLTGGFVGQNFNSADVGLIAGGGVEIYRIGIEARGNWGFKSVSGTGGGAFVSTTDSPKAFSFELLGKFRFN